MTPLNDLRAAAPRVSLARPRVGRLSALTLALALAVGCGDNMPTAEDDDASLDAVIDGGQVGDGEGGDGGLEDDGALGDATSDAADIGTDGAGDASDAGGAPCEKDDDCAKPEAACVKVTCGASKTCQETPLAAGSPCSDGDACTPDDTCDDQGACLPGTATSCDDNNACTTDSCDKSAGCVHGPGGSDCSDGDACTEGDSCADGACVSGTPKDCDDGNPCTSDSCDEAKGCLSVASAGACDDDDACTEGDLCKGAACTPGTPVSCDDGKVCTADSCDQAKGCVYAAAAGGCDDGDACTAGDTCGNGACLPGAATSCDDDNVCTDDSCDPKTGCVHLANAATCSDDDACTQGDACKEAQCAPGAALTCDDNNPCTADLCNPKLGCTTAPMPVGATCTDGNACTVGDGCDGKGQCASGAVDSCDDDNACTTDSCDPSAGCTHTNNDKPCTDGSVCTTGDQCAAGKCVGGGSFDCDDGNPCTDDSCDPKLGCVTMNNAAKCDDNNSCTTGETCSGGSCTATTPSQCDDGNVCTTESCDPTKGCQSAPNTSPCADGDICTQDDTCKGGSCVAGAPQSCGDGNPCTTDTCDAKSGCVNLPGSATCSDGNACTKDDACVKGECVAQLTFSCDDSQVCTADSCDPKIGCQHKDIDVPCTDGDPCTAGDACKAGSCVSGPAADCDDGNVCTTDTCTKGGDSGPGGCVSLPNQLTCTDGNACTAGDQCAKGACQPGQAVDCDDNNVCTADSCAVSTGCAHTNVAALCTDGDVCTLSDVCKDGQCTSAATLKCSDGNPCTDDSCDKKTGCTFTANSGKCSDGNACTTGDVCKGGACTPGKAKACDDSNPCTDDSCDLAKGCVYKANTAPCTDGDACTVNDACAATQCVSGGKRICVDSNPCTTDSCDKAKGCVFAPNSQPCDDGDACTVKDTCKNGTCGQFVKLDCDDKNACTSDSCDKAKGCVNLPHTLTCTDNNACTDVDQCAGGKCVPGKKKDCDDGSVCTVDSCVTWSGCSYKAEPTESGFKADSKKPVYNGVKGVWTIAVPSHAGGLHLRLITQGDYEHSSEFITWSINGSQPVKYNAYSQAGKYSPLWSVGAKPTVDGKVGLTIEATSAVSYGTVIPWLFWKAGKVCDDNDACTVGDGCVSGKCQSSAKVTCDDNNVCTSDSCDKAKGCVYTPVKDGAACTDGSACTDKDSCVAGKCAAGKPLVCSDGNACTTDSCDKLKGCQAVAVSDDTVCGSNMVCKSGKCVVSLHAPLKSVVIAGLHNAHNGNLGGLTGADALCNKEAKAAGRTEVFKAFLSSSKQHVKDLITGSNATGLPVVNIKGQKLFNSWADIFDGSYSYSPTLFTFHNRLIDENTGASPDWYDADGWTGSSTTGTYVSGKSCNDWTSASSSVLGQNTEVDARQMLRQEQTVCSRTLAVLCVSVKGALEDPTYGTASNPAASCLDLLTQRPSLAKQDGDYYVKTAKSASLKVYCDMTTEGGGYTFYPVASGKTTYRFTDNDSCKDLGLTMVMPRSKAHWSAMLAKYGTSYFTTIPGVYKVGNGGNYTGCVMRHPGSYGSGCSGWRVGDGGRWWLRDSKYSEPNGDYTSTCWLSMYKWDVNDIRYNDGNCSYWTKKYVCSTNDKK